MHFLHLSKFRLFFSSARDDSKMLYYMTLRLQIEEIQASVVGGQIRMESKQSNVSRVVINSLGRYSPLKISSFEPSSTVKIELYRGYRHGNISRFS
jgi:hypothetical protein